MGKVKEVTIMGKVICNHCKDKFKYKTTKKYSKDMEITRLTTKLNMTEIDGRFYCQPCRKKICDYVIDPDLVIDRAIRLGMKFIKEQEDKINQRDVRYKDGSPIMKVLNKLRLVKQTKTK